MKKLIAMLLMSAAVWAQMPELVVSTGHSNSVTVVDFMPNSDFFATGSADNTIILWNIRNMQKIRTFTGDTAQIEDMSFHPNGKWLASCSWDSTLRI